MTKLAKEQEKVEHTREREDRKTFDPASLQYHAFQASTLLRLSAFALSEVRYKNGERAGQN